MAEPETAELTLAGRDYRHRGQTLSLVRWQWFDRLCGVWREVLDEHESSILDYAYAREQELAALRTECDAIFQLAVEKWNEVDGHPRAHGENRVDRAGRARAFALEQIEAREQELAAARERIAELESEVAVKLGVWGVHSFLKPLSNDEEPTDAP